jgi:hypothetical protein
MMARMDANLKSTQERMNAGHKKMMAWIKDLKINGEETMACQEKTEPRLQGEPASEDMTLEVAHEQEFPLEDAVVMPVGELRKRRWDQRHLATQRRQKKEEEWTQSKNGCQKDLVAACRGMTRHATVAWCKRNILRKSWTQRNCGLRREVTAAGMRITHCAGHRRKRQNKDDAERETRRERTEKNRQRKGPLCKTGKKNPTMNNIEGRNPGERAPLRSGGTRKKDICNIFRAKIMEHGVGTSCGYEEGRNGPCGGVSPLRNGRRNSIRVRRARCGGAPVPPGVIVPSSEKVTVRMRECERERE